MSAKKTCETCYWWDLCRDKDTERAGSIKKEPGDGNILHRIVKTAKCFLSINYDCFYLGGYDIRASHEDVAAWKRSTIRASVEALETEGCFGCNQWRAKDGC